MIKRLSLAIAVCVCLASGCVAAEVKVRQVYLIQNSGWMEPYFLDQKSQFLKLASSLVTASELEGIDITIASFNQAGQIPGRQSPAIVFEGPFNAEKADHAVKTIELPRRPNGKYADADFLGALQATIGDVLHGEQGIIWMLSNNKNSPDNSQDVAANTRGFYDLLRNSEFVTRIVAFPVRMTVVGPHFNEKGFIIYGIAYGADAGRALDVLTGRDTPLRQLFTSPPVFLKPIEPQTLELELSTQSVADDTSVSIQNGILVIDGLAASASSNIAFRGQVRNVAYPKKIAAAQINAAWHSGGGTGEIAVEPAELTNLASGAVSNPVAFNLTLPSVARSPGLTGLLESETIVDGEVTIALNRLAFDLDDSFVERAAAVFGGEMMGEGQKSFVEQQLPSIFFDFRNVNESLTKVPVRLIYRFSLWPLYVGSALLLLLLGLLAAIPFIYLRSRLYAFDIAGNPQRLRLKPGQTLQVLGGDGRLYLVKGRVFGLPSVHPLPNKP